MVNIIIITKTEKQEVLIWTEHLGGIELVKFVSRSNVSCERVVREPVKVGVNPLQSTKSQRVHVTELITVTQHTSDHSLANRDSCPTLAKSEA